jgi:hypothetical protein
MVNYESLLLGGKQKKSVGGKMTYEERCKNLEKARATRASNLKHKVKGGGNYTQDYVDESQINYAGSPLDMYYINSSKQARKQREDRGEIGRGLGAMEALTGGKIRRKKKVEKELESESESEEMEGGRMHRRRKLIGKGNDSMTYMKNSMHTGLDMPTESEFKKGGKMKGGKIIHKVGEYKVDLTGAIENLANLASKFGLRLVK